LAGAVINIILNFTLIPLIGVNGAAFATFISYALVFFLRAVNTRHYIPVNWNTPKLTLNTVIMLAQCLILIASPKYWIIYESVLFLLMVIINLQGLLSTLNRLLGRKKKRRHKHLAED
jgi:O-antigen/teichoic acid export membrane protein